MTGLGRRWRLLSLVLLLAVTATVIVSGSAGEASAAPPGCTVTGAAFGGQATGPVSLAPTAPIALPPGGTATGASSTAGIGGALLTTGAITNTASDDSTTTAAIATSTSTVNDATLFNPGGDLPVALITATTIRTTVTSTVDATGTAAVSTGDVEFENLVVNGVPVAGTFAPNTRIEVTNPRTGEVVGFVIVNEQVPTGNGTTSTGLTVNAARLVTTAPVGNVPAGAEAIIASATTSASCTGPDGGTPTATATATPTPSPATATATRTPTPAGALPTATAVPPASPADTARLGTPSGGPRPTAVATAVPGLPSTGGGRGTGGSLLAVLTLGVVLGVVVARALRRVGTTRGEG